MYLKFAIVRKRFTHFVRKVFACWKLPSGKFRLFGPLASCSIKWNPNINPGWSSLVFKQSHSTCPDLPKPSHSLALRGQHNIRKRSRHNHPRIDCKEFQGHFLRMFLGASTLKMGTIPPSAFPLLLPFPHHVSLIQDLLCQCTSLWKLWTGLQRRI